MKTIEELFVNEYEKQKETISDLNQVVYSLTENIKELKDDIKALKEHHQATIEEVKRFGLTYHRAGYINAYCAIYGKELEDEFPILVNAGCINPLEENENGTK